MAAVSATALASAMFAMPAFAETVGIDIPDSPNVTGYEETSSETTFNLLDTQETCSTISVTAPTAVYMAITDPASTTGTGSKEYVFTTPSQTAVVFTNHGSNAVTIDSWAVSKIGNAVSKTDFDSKKQSTNWYSTDSSEALVADKFWLQARNTLDSADTKYDIALASTDSANSAYTSSNAWTIGKATSTNNEMHLDLSGAIYNPTDEAYGTDTEIQKVIWTFKIES